MIWLWILCGIALFAVITAVILLIRRHKRIKAENARDEYFREQNRWLKEQFSLCNVIVFGKKRTGKDLLFAHVIYLRDDKHYANIPYNDNTEVIELKDISVGDNDFLSIIENKIEKISRRFDLGKDIYLSDAGIFFPSQYYQILDKQFKGMPITFAICGHLFQNNIHLNCQELTRVWDKLREQADCYIRVLGNEWHGSYVLVNAITYTDYNAANRGILPPAAKSERELAEFQSQHGEVVYRTFRIYEKELEYNTHYFATKFFED